MSGNASEFSRHVSQSRSSKTNIFFYGCDFYLLQMQFNFFVPFHFVTEIRHKIRNTHQDASLLLSEVIRNTEMFR
jgi:hypothetical protein